MMMERRSLFGMIAALFVAPAVVSKLKAKAPEVALSSFSDADAAALLPSLIRRYNQRRGDLGRGSFFPAEKVIALERILLKSGFAPYQPWAEDQSRFIQVYGFTGAPCSVLWFGWIRSHTDGGGEVVAFEAEPSEIRRMCELMTVNDPKWASAFKKE